ncbi:Os08g0336200, partial [Oryza sativa Japonica Group]
KLQALSLSPSLQSITAGRRSKFPHNRPSALFVRRLQPPSPSRVSRRSRPFLPLAAPSPSSLCACEEEGRKQEEERRGEEEEIKEKEED